MIVYASRTGNVKYIANNIPVKSIEIEEGMTVNEPYLILTYTDNLGEVPNVVSDFLVNNYKYCKGVIASGNSNFGHQYFCNSADKISSQYNVPIIKKIELRGFQKDYDEIKLQYYNLIEGDN